MPFMSRHMSCSILLLACLDGRYVALEPNNSCLGTMTSRRVNRENERWLPDNLTAPSLLFPPCFFMVTRDRYRAHAGLRCSFNNGSLKHVISGVLLPQSARTRLHRQPILRGCRHQGRNHRCLRLPCVTVNSKAGGQLSKTSML